MQEPPFTKIKVVIKELLPFVLMIVVGVILSFWPHPWPAHNFVEFVAHALVVAGIGVPGEILIFVTVR